MATKVIVLGEESKKAKQPKPIEFIKRIIESGNWEKPESNPSDWKFVYLICKKWRATELDLMICCDDEEMKNGALVLGHFNDGVV